MSLDCWRMYLVQQPRCSEVRSWVSLDSHRLGEEEFSTKTSFHSEKFIPNMTSFCTRCWRASGLPVKSNTESDTTILHHSTEQWMKPLVRFWLSCYIPWKSILRIWMNHNLIVLNHWMEQCMEVWYHSYMDLSKIGHPRASLVSMDCYIITINYPHE
jgi:hypothetical protein